MKKLYITTPIYYINSEPHIGSVYTTLMADILNRFNKLNDVNTRFLTGTDEHGQKIQQSAQDAGMNEIDFANKMAKKFRDLADYMNFSYDDFIRTTESRHKKFVQKIWEKLVKNNWIYKGKYSGWYCVSDEAYYTEDELVKISDGEFKTTLGKTVEWKEEESYFFKLSKFQKILLELYDKTDFIQPEYRKNEVVAFVGGKSIKELENNSFESGYLKDLSISRNNFSWGIKIPVDENGERLLDDSGNWFDSITKNEQHVMYVWLDALFNYQSALDSVGKIVEFWYNSDIIHIVGKDILRFHGVYWPALLIATEFSEDQIDKITINDVLSKNVLPKTIFAHGWWTNNGKKISKSLGNAINIKDEVNWLINEYNIEENIAKDYIKYYLSTETTFGSDGDYSRDRLIEKINSELVNNIGNLIQRVLSMLFKNITNNNISISISSDKELEILLTTKTLSKFDFQEYKNLILDISSKANVYMEDKAPWNLKKENKLDEMLGVLKNELSEIIKIVVLLKPLCPFIVSEIFDYFKIDIKNFSYIYSSNFVENLIISEPKIFFPKLINK